MNMLADASPEVARLRALSRSGLVEALATEHFGSLTDLVRDVIGVPVSFVSVVDEDRQRLYGHWGLPAEWAARSETPIAMSFCRHVVARGRPLRVVDARVDPVLCDNAAIGELGVVAYLGVPLFLPGGDILGALAAVDNVPRAWSDEDERRLEKIGAIATQEVAARLSEIGWHQIFENLQESFALAEAVRDPGGRVVDWRYVDVNRTWCRLAGRTAAEVVGGTARQMFPEVEPSWVAAVAGVLDSGEALHFTRQFGSPARWYDGVVQPAGGDRFSVISTDVTARVEAERRAEARLLLGDRLRDLKTIAELGGAVADVLERTLGAARAGFGLVDESMQTIDVRSGGGEGRLAAFSGRRLLREVSLDPDALGRGRRVSVRDLSDDARETPMVLRGVRASIEQPIMENGRLVALAFVHDDEPRDWTEEEGEFVRDLADRTQHATARVEAEARRLVLGQELSHRLKNTLAVVTSIVTQTLRTAPDVQTGRKTLLARIFALSKAHDMLLSGQRESATVEAVVGGAVALHDEGGRVKTAGPVLSLGPKAALTLSLIVHELATNAGKYGALSVERGLVDLSWDVTQGDGGRPVLQIAWVERGGPPVVAPVRRGFGTRLVEMGLSGSSGGDVVLDFAPDGLRCHIRAPLMELVSGGEDE